MKLEYRLSEIDFKHRPQVNGREYHHPKASVERLKRLQRFVSADEARLIDVYFTFDETKRELRVAEISLPLGRHKLVERLNTVMPQSAAMKQDQLAISGVQMEVLLQSLPAPDISRKP